jgi:hypothetical protein
MFCAPCMKMRLLDLLEERGGSSPEHLEAAIAEVPEAVPIEERAVCWDCFINAHFLREKTLQRLQRAAPARPVDDTKGKEV